LMVIFTPHYREINSFFLSVSDLLAFLKRERLA